MSMAEHPENKWFTRVSSLETLHELTERLFPTWLSSRGQTLVNSVEGVVLYNKHGQEVIIGTITEIRGNNNVKYWQELVARRVDGLFSKQLALEMALALEHEL